jgi:hypothetical protein
MNCYNEFNSKAAAEVAAEQILVLHKLIKTRFEGSDPEVIN